MRRTGPLETPLLRVSRPVSACSRCRAAKIKCDGKLPACTACEKSGRVNECSSANDQFAKGKERSYVASLESRVEKLERRIAYARSRKESVAMHEADEPPSEPPDRKDSLATIRAAIHGKAARRREAADVNELVSDFGFLSVDATTRDFEAATTNMTFARLVLAATMNEPVPQEKTFQLPPRPSAMALVQYYLDNVYALYPVFSETALFNALDAIYQVNGRPVADFEHWLLFMVLAVASVAQSRTRADPFYADGVAWVGRALKYADKVLTPGYIVQIQALVMLVQYSMLDPAHFDSWQLVGFTCRAVVDLGFHQDAPKEQQPDKNALDLRRKVFYCVYSLDSMVHFRAFSFADDTVNVALPSMAATIANDHSPPVVGPHSLETALHFFQLRTIQSRWYQELFQSSRSPLQGSSNYLWQVCQEMREWSESYPGGLPSAMRKLFDLEVLYSYVYCLAPSSRVPAVSEYGKTLIFEYSIAYMQKMFPFSRDPLNPAFITYHDALRVFFIGSQFMAVVEENQERLLNGVIPYVALLPGAPPPPPLPSSGRENNVERSINCIIQINDTLKTFGQRWEDSKALQSTFETQSQALLNSLHQIRMRRGDRPAHSQSPPSMSPPMSNQMGAVFTDNWNHMGQHRYGT
ncbi:fungal-specific transcription factor domain-containing protein [Xylogone sp. PMI_703]|nr:fungal-specific transcription factor domain-containing protein [Xylogone sp. PMI_703]